MTSSSSPGPQTSIQLQPPKPNQVGTVMLYGIPIVSLMMESTERLCLAQISNTLLKDYSYNEIHNRRVALGITCVQCTPVQLEMLRRAGAMPVSSRRCGMITRREAERLCKSFLGDNSPPRLPEDFAFAVHHSCAWGCTGSFIPSRYNSSRAKCIKCTVCGLFFSPNKFIFHSHRTGPQAKYVQPDAANFNSWRRHMRLSGSPPEAVTHAWEDVKAMFNGGTRKRLVGRASERKSEGSPRPPPSPRVPPLPLVVDWFKPYYPLPWLPPAPLLLPDRKTPYTSAFTPVTSSKEDSGDETVDIETCPEDDVKPSWSPPHLTQKNDTVSPSSPKATQLSRSESPNSVPERKSEEAPEVWRYGFTPSSYNMARHLHLIKELSVPALTNRDQISVVYPPPPTDLSLNDKNYGPLDCSTCSQISPYPPVLPVPLRHPTQPN